MGIVSPVTGCIKKVPKDTNVFSLLREGGDRAEMQVPLTGSRGLIQG